MGSERKVPIFSNFSVPPSLHEGVLRGLRIEHLNEIERKILDATPHGDLVVQSPHGSGKSTGALIRMLGRINPSLLKTQALCLCPNRGSAIQTFHNVKKLTHYMNVKSHIALTAGRSLQAFVCSHIIVATIHGVEMDVGLECLKFVMIDEADMFFLDEPLLRDRTLKFLREVEDKAPDFQLILLTSVHGELSTGRMEKTQLSFAEDGEQSKVLHYSISCQSVESKIQVITDYITELELDLPTDFMIFVTEEDSTKLAKALTKRGYEISNFLNPPRFDPFGDSLISTFFLNRYTQILLTDDTSVRGINSQWVGVVINFNVPTPNQYFHRSAHVGRKGCIFNLIQEDDGERMLHLQKYYKFLEVKWEDNYKKSSLLDEEEEDDSMEWE